MVLRCRFPALFSALLALIAVTGCQGRDADSPIIPGVVLGEFWGEVRDGEVILHLMEDGAADGADGLDASSPGTAEQGLLRIREDKNGTPGTAGAADGIELVVERTAPYVGPQTVANGCGPGVASFEFNVTVRNFFQTAITNVFAEINDITPPAEHAICNSDTPTVNLQIDGTPLITDNGLVRYGHLSRDPNGFATAPAGSAVPPPLGTDVTAQAMVWRFRSGTGTFNFTGRVVADLCTVDCPPGAIAQEGANVSINNARPFGDTNGTVNALIEGNGVGYIGGSFSEVGRATGAAFATDRNPAVVGLAQGPWAPIVGGSVSALAPDGAGGFYVGGAFTQVGNTLQPRLAHILDSGELDTAFAPGTTLTSTGEVRALALDASTNRLWVGRSVAPFLSVIDATTGADALLLTTAPADQVFDIQIVNDTVVVVGEFRNLGNANRDKVAVYDRAGNLQPFALQVAGGGNVSVDAVATDGTTLWFGGEFTFINGTGGGTRNRLAAATIATSTLLPWNPSANGTVRTLKLQGGPGGVVYLGGAFTQVRGSTRNRVAAVSANPAVAAPVLRTWNPNAGADVNDLVVDGAFVYMSGTFTNLSGATRDRHGAVTANPDAATILQAWNPAIATLATGARSILVVDVAGDRLLVGGNLLYGGWLRRQNVAAFSLTTGEFTAFDAPTNNVVRAFALSPDAGTLYLGGDFTLVNGVARNRVAAVNGATGELNAGFTANVANNSVFALAADATHVYVGGNFTGFGGRNRLARVAVANGAVDATYTATADNTVRALNRTGPDLLVGGDFTTMPGPAVRFARLSTTAPGAVLTNYNANNTVTSIAVSKNVAYAGGLFTSVLATGRNRVAAIDLRNQTVLTSFNANVNNAVTSVAAAGPAVVVGGSFTSVGGQTRTAFAVVDATTGAPFASAPIATGSVNAVAVMAGTFVGGGLLGTTAVNVVTAGTTTAPSRRLSTFVVNAD